VKQLIKIMVVFATIYAIAGMMRNVRLQPAFTFLATALISLLSIAFDRIFMPKLSRIKAVLLDALLFALTLFGADKAGPGKENRISWPYIGLVASVLGGFEGLFHEWVYKREAYEEPKGGNVH
jgi:hypothetical protein